jgi:hypothetical protein
MPASMASYSSRRLPSPVNSSVRASARTRAMSITARNPSTMRQVAASRVAAASSTTGSGVCTSDARTSTPITSGTDTSGALSVQTLLTRSAPGSGRDRHTP